MDTRPIVIDLTVDQEVTDRESRAAKRQKKWRGEDVHPGQSLCGHERITDNGSCSTDDSSDSDRDMNPEGGDDLEIDPFELWIGQVRPDFKNLYLR